MVRDHPHYPHDNYHEKVSELKMENRAIEKEVNHLRGCELSIPYVTTKLNESKIKVYTFLESLITYSQNSQPLFSLGYESFFNSLKTPIKAEREQFEEESCQRRKKVLRRVKSSLSSKAKDHATAKHKRVQKLTKLRELLGRIKCERAKRRSNSKGLSWMHRKLDGSAIRRRETTNLRRRLPNRQPSISRSYTMVNADNNENSLPVNEVFKENILGSLRATTGYQDYQESASEIKLRPRQGMDLTKTRKLSVADFSRFEKHIRNTSGGESLRLNNVFKKRRDFKASDFDFLNGSQRLHLRITGQMARSKTERVNESNESEGVCFDQDLHSKTRIEHIEKTGENETIGSSLEFVMRGPPSLKIDSAGQESGIHSISSSSNTKHL